MIMNCNSVLSSIQGGEIAFLWINCFINHFAQRLGSIYFQVLVLFRTTLCRVSFATVLAWFYFSSRSLNDWVTLLFITILFINIQRKLQLAFRVNRGIKGKWEYERPFCWKSVKRNQFYQDFRIISSKGLKMKIYPTLQVPSLLII